MLYLESIAVCVERQPVVIVEVCSHDMHTLQTVTFALLSLIDGI